MGKYNDWTRGEDEAILNIIGGTDIARDILRGKYKLTVEKVVREQFVNKFYRLLTDDEAIAWIVEYAQKHGTEACQIVYGFRQEARKRGIADTVKLHAEVQPGCLFKRDIPQMGPCMEDFEYLQNWDFSDPATERCLVSWTAVPLADSTNKNAAEQTEILATFKTKAGLPAWYDVSFGSANHVSGLALAHYNATGQDPFNSLWIRTDACYADGRRLWLGWDEGRLRCVVWFWGADRYSFIAVFALGVVKALGH